MFKNKPNSSDVESIKNKLGISLGENGAELIKDTTAHTGTFKAIQIIGDAVFSVLTSAGITTDGSVLAIGSDYGTVSAGVVLYGTFTAITLTSGIVIAYL